MSAVAPRTRHRRRRASYSPEGSKITFARGRLSGGGVDLFKMNPDGTGIARVIDTKARFEILPQCVAG